MFFLEALSQFLDMAVVVSSCCRSVVALMLGKRKQFMGSKSACAQGDHIYVPSPPSVSLVHPSHHLPFFFLSLIRPLVFETPTHWTSEHYLCRTTQGARYSHSSSREFQRRPIRWHRKRQIQLLFLITGPSRSLSKTIASKLSLVKDDNILWRLRGIFKLTQPPFCILPGRQAIPNTRRRRHHLNRFALSVRQFQLSSSLVRRSNQAFDGSTRHGVGRHWFRLVWLVSVLFSFLFCFGLVQARRYNVVGFLLSLLLIVLWFVCSCKIRSSLPESMNFFAPNSASYLTSFAAATLLILFNDEMVST